MKKLLSILTLQLFVFGLFSQSFIVLNYELNKEVLTELFCINKEKPMTMCMAKCHLQKQLEQDQEQKEKKQLSQTMAMFFVATVAEDFSFNKTAMPSPLVQKGITPYRFTIIQKLSTQIFHPPKSFC